MRQWLLLRGLEIELGMFDMHEDFERIVGFVDAFSYDDRDQSISFHGWSVDELKPLNELEFRVTLDGQDYPLRVLRHVRPDLAHYPAPDLGFTITCLGFSDASVTGLAAVKVYARALNARSSWQELSMGHMAIEQILRHVWLKQIAKLNGAQVGRLISDLFPKIRALLSTENAEASGGGAPVNPGNHLNISACTEVYIPKGFTSFDGTCVLGGGGHAFLIGGSNDVLESYNVEPGSPRVVDQGNSWIDLFQKRQAECDRRNIRYVQTIVPEKISVMPELVEYDIEGPTRLLSFIEDGMKKANVGYVSGYDALVEENKFDTFCKIDTHFAPFGAFKVFKRILEKAGILEDINPIFQSSDFMMVGDIAERFIVNSTLMYPDTVLLQLPAPLSDETLELVDEFNPTTNGHIGVRRIFRNPLAPIDRKLLVFGNSFFERGGHPKTLTWWFARMFTEFHFIWHPEFDWDYVNQISPDIIIGQTIERFLTKVPEF